VHSPWSFRGYVIVPFRHLLIGHAVPVFIIALFRLLLIGHPSARSYIMLSWQFNCFYPESVVSNEDLHPHDLSTELLLLQLQFGSKDDLQTKRKEGYDMSNNIFQFVLRSSFRTTTGPCIRHAVSVYDDTVFINYFFDFCWLVIHGDERRFEAFLQYRSSGGGYHLESCRKGARIAIPVLK